ncbi:ABC transporter ATP-binding protein [Ornithinimicrobium pratense]|uniref:ABC transporter ATP-binding protein n=1 Tax=Ornithinimicrobium pratense TaxID=2593973 RepID=A0A5J6V6Q5_9MICO|nr:ABC transporter ATP-binding protein [Ornithinimicrobium pratense]QFG69468.1 ABC transporter ATP-binding protein [Ornithinimicrobium pratense]
MGVLQVQDLAWRAAGRLIVSGVDLTVAPGRVTGIVGPNGSGKTTVLHLIAGLRIPARGRVLLGGEDVLALSPRERARRIALVEQKAGTNLDLTAREVVALGRHARRPRWGRPDRDDAVDRALQMADAAGLADRSWATMSGGEQQRVHLARALAQEPQVLLLDEPTNHLDLAHQIGLLQLVRSLDCTTLVVLHDLDLAAASCDELVVMDAGRVVASGSTAEVLAPGLLEDVFAVRTSVRHEERLRVLWHGLAESSPRRDAG